MPTENEPSEEGLPPPPSEGAAADLRVAPTESSRWSKFLNASAIIAALALVFTVTIWWLSAREQDKEDERAARRELSAVLSDLAQLDRTYLPLLLEVEALDDDDDRAILEANVKKLKLREADVLLDRAEVLIDANEGIVTSGDYLAWANGLVDTEPLRTVEAALLAEELAIEERNLENATVSRRIIGGYSIPLGEISQGREAFKRALSWEDFDPPANRLLQQASRSDTLLQWAQAEVVVGNCSDAQELLEDVVALATTVQEQVELLRKQMARRESEGLC